MEMLVAVGICKPMFARGLGDIVQGWAEFVHKGQG